MPQVKTGTVTVTNGSNIVTGDSVNWTLVKVNSIFVVKNRAQSYLVQNVDATATPPTITLERDYTEASGSGLGYGIHIDFTPYLALPVLSTGDIETASILARALARLDLKYAEVLEGGGPGTGTSDVVITVPNANAFFVVGSIVAINNTGDYVLASNDDASLRSWVGVVSNIAVDNATVTIKTTGRVSNIAGSSLVAGTIYYVHANNTASNWGTEGQIVSGVKLPVFQALSNTEAFILSSGLATAEFIGASAITDGAPGTVPAPVAGQQSSYLRGDGTWAPVEVPDGSINYGDLLQSSAPSLRDDGTMIWDETESNRATDPVPNYLHDLWYRLRSMALRQLSDTPSVVQLDFTGVVGTVQSFTVPAGVHFVMLELWSAGGRGFRATSDKNNLADCHFGGPAGSYVRMLLTNLTPGDTFSVVVGQGEQMVAQTWPSFQGGTIFDPASYVSAGSTTTTYVDLTHNGVTTRLATAFGPGHYDVTPITNLTINSIASNSQVAKLYKLYGYVYRRGNALRTDTTYNLELFSICQPAPGYINEDFVINNFERMVNLIIPSVPPTTANGQFAGAKQFGGGRPGVLIGLSSESSVDPSDGLLYIDGRTPAAGGASLWSNSSNSGKGGHGRVKIYY